MNVNFSFGSASGSGFSGSRHRKTGKKAHPVFALIMGVVFIAFGFYSRWEQTAFFKTCKKTTGVVTGHVKKTDKESDSSRRKSDYPKTYYYPVVRFETQGGDEISFTASSRYSSETDIPEGREMDVYYDPTNPSKARLYGKMNNTPKIAWGGGGLLILFGIVGMVLRKRKSKQIDVNNPGSTMEG
jgi:hypothetical protein